MSYCILPRYIKIDTLALNTLTNDIQASGIRELPPVSFCGSELRLYQDRWEQWLSRQGRCFSRQSYIDLFRAQANDGNTTSLSAEDLHTPFIVTGPLRSAEQHFTQTHGMPEAIFSEGRLRILRMSNGTYWSEEVHSQDIIFRLMSSEEGRQKEAHIANATLSMLNEQFIKFPMLRDLFKTTTRENEEMNSPTNFLQTQILTFADIRYRFGNKNSLVAYRSQGDTSRYFLSQPQNACIAASILNGAIFSGHSISNNSQLLQDFQNRIVHLQNSENGRILLEPLLQSIRTGEIPGLRFQRVNANRVSEHINNRRPLVALVPELFFGHAFAIIETPIPNRTYRAVDTVSGMMVERNLYAPSSCSRTLKRCTHEIYLSIEIVDLRAFLRWIRKY